MDKEQTAMERLRLASDMSLRLYHRPLLLTDSGGKDSAVICKLAENAGIPFEIVHSHTTAASMYTTGGWRTAFCRGSSRLRRMNRDQH